MTVWGVEAREMVDLKGREKVTKWWLDTVSGVTESANTKGPCEVKVKLIPDLVGAWRGGECQVKRGEEVTEFRWVQLLWVNPEVT